MKKKLLLLLCCFQAYALPVSLKTFSADFEQRITDEHNKTIRYSGNLQATAPDTALWRYMSPVKKDVFVSGKTVTVIEPDLEQAICKRLDGDIDLFSLLENALPLGKGLYQASYRTKRFTIAFDKETLSSIRYTDEFDNDVMIVFSKQRQNQPLDESALRVEIPEGFDVIRN